MIRKRVKAPALAAVVAAAVQLSAPALAEHYRQVFVNGVRLSDQNMLILQQAYGIQIPDGSYVYDPASGYFAPAGSAEYGDSYGQGGYSDIYSNGPNGHYGANAGGYVGSDGECSYVHMPGTGSVMTGNC